MTFQLSRLSNGGSLSRPDSPARPLPPTVSSPGSSKPGSPKNCRSPHLSHRRCDSTSTTEIFLATEVELQHEKLFSTLTLLDAPLSPKAKEIVDRDYHTVVFDAQTSGSGIVFFHFSEEKNPKNQFLELNESELETIDSLVVQNVSQEHVSYAERFQYMKNIFELSFHACHALSNEMLQMLICSLPKLTSLSIVEHNTISDETLQVILSKCKKTLKKLEIKNCPMIKDQAIITKECEELEYLDLSENTLSDNFFLRCCESLPRLYRLILSGCQKVTGEKVMAIAATHYLKKIDISRCINVSRPAAIDIQIKCGSQCQLISDYDDLPVLPSNITTSLVQFGDYLKSIFESCAYSYDDKTISIKILSGLGGARLLPKDFIIIFNALKKLIESRKIYLEVPWQAFFQKTSLNTLIYELAPFLTELKIVSLVEMRQEPSFKEISFPKLLKLTLAASSYSLCKKFFLPDLLSLHLSGEAKQLSALPKGLKVLECDMLYFQEVVALCSEVEKIVVSNILGSYEDSFDRPLFIKVVQSQCQLFEKVQKSTVITEINFVDYFLIAHKENISWLQELCLQYIKTLGGFLTVSYSAPMVILEFSAPFFNYFTFYGGALFPIMQTLGQKAEVEVRIKKACAERSDPQTLYDLRNSLALLGRSVKKIIIDSPNEKSFAFYIPQFFLVEKLTIQNAMLNQTFFDTAISCRELELDGCEGITGAHFKNRPEPFSVFIDQNKKVSIRHPTFSQLMQLHTCIAAFEKPKHTTTRTITCSAVEESLEDILVGFKKLSLDETSCVLSEQSYDFKKDGSLSLVSSLEKVTIKNSALFSDDELALMQNIVQRLESFTIVSCPKISAKAFFFLQNTASNLTSLTISDCPLSDKEFKNKTLSFFKLESLTLSSTQVGNYFLTAIKKGMPNLTSLRLAGCEQITDEMVGFILQTFPKLTLLDISRCPNITKNVLLHVIKLGKNLNRVKLTGCTSFKEVSWLLSQPKDTTKALAFDMSVLEKETLTFFLSYFTQASELQLIHLLNAKQELFEVLFSELLKREKTSSSSLFISSVSILNDGQPVSEVVLNTLLLLENMTKLTIDGTVDKVILIKILNKCTKLQSLQISGLSIETKEHIRSCYSNISLKE